eukprot:180168_1
MSAAETCRIELKRLMKEVENNKHCADCGGFPATWASTNLGVFLCTGCSGIHRSLGVHISFVKSATLDDWNAKLLQRFKQQGGNAVVNAKYEAKLKSMDKIEQSFHTDPSRKIEIVKFIRNKYEKKIWYKDTGDKRKKKKRSKTKRAKTLTPIPSKSKPKDLQMKFISRSPTPQSSTHSLSPSPSPNLKVMMKRKESLLSDDELDEFHRDFSDLNASKEAQKVEKVTDILELIQEIPIESSSTQLNTVNGNVQPQQIKTNDSAKSILSKYHNYNMMNNNMDMNGSFANQYQYQAQGYVNNNNSPITTNQYQYQPQNGMQNYGQQNSPITTNSANYYGGNVMFNANGYSVNGNQMNNNVVYNQY